MLKAYVLIIHGLLAITLIGAITHQALSVLRRQPATPARDFYNRFRNVNSGVYVDFITWTYLITFVFGGWVYTWYRVDVRPIMEDLQYWTLFGLFELKEHFGAFGLFLLPMYYLLWKRPELAQYRQARNAVTVLLCLFVWFTLVAGHVINNYKGIYP